MLSLLHDLKKNVLSNDITVLIRICGKWWVHFIQFDSIQLIFRYKVWSRLTFGSASKWKIGSGSAFKWMKGSRSAAHVPKSVQYDYGYGIG